MSGWTYGSRSPYGPRRLGTQRMYRYRVYLNKEPKGEEEVLREMSHELKIQRNQ